jgi:hypothetical protein
MGTGELPRYERRIEEPASALGMTEVPVSELPVALDHSSLSAGSRDLVRALVRLARPALFGGGGVGLEYGALLKTAARPDLLRGHIEEVARHLVERQVDLLFVPGMSGYPIGSMYSMASGIPAVLLKKQSYTPWSVEELPPGAFVIPSYTGNTDTVISADLPAARDMIEALVDRQIEAQQNRAEVIIEIRIAGADEIIDKATMATAITETAPIFTKAVVDEVLPGRADAIAGRPVTVICPVVAWVTPLLKAYAGSGSVLSSRFGIEPFAGATLSAIQLDPPAIGIDGIGLVLLEAAR